MTRWHVRRGFNATTTSKTQEKGKSIGVVQKYAPRNVARTQHRGRGARGGKRRRKGVLRP